MNKAELITKAVELELGTEADLEAKTVVELKDMIKAKEDAETEEVSETPADETTEMPEGPAEETPEVQREDADGRDLYEMIYPPKEEQDRGKIYSRNVGGAVVTSGQQVYLDEATLAAHKQYFKKL